MRKYQDLLSEQIMEFRNRLIHHALPEDASLSNVVMTQHGHGGKEVYSHNGEAFLEIYPTQYEHLYKRQEGSTVLNVSFEYRVLK